MYRIGKNENEKWKLFSGMRGGGEATFRYISVLLFIILAQLLRKLKKNILAW